MVLEALALKALIVKFAAIAAATAAVAAVATVFYLRKEDIEEWFNSQDVGMDTNSDLRPFVRREDMGGSYRCTFGYTSLKTGELIAGKVVNAQVLDPAAFQQINWEFAS